ncbi:hypothetical protein IW140_004917 [Coemansia sp. RSA 1813]|nr:hypothetical protein EV178_005210 [Coemansia sp. RSA 1646]KAJ1771922.1 hypothetical protein LPJ74_001956 [Coemansia sp. RSA 1843]KAJ2087385.1 hypothetical protein IW138_005002 [Coemansia sp. RSA 986]KAJ2566448.1 hypothetical protein IW140_004917 [Coemansia sp. RSA 1813]
MQDALNTLPEPTPQCPVARVLGTRGQHLHEVVVARSVVADDINQRLNPENKPWFATLAQLPPKYRSVVWVKRGGYAMVDLTEQLTDKIGGEIALVLMAKQVKHLKQSGQWPTEYEGIWNDIMGASRYSENKNSEKTGSSDGQLSDSGTDSDLSSSSSSSSSSDDDVDRANTTRRYTEKSSADEDSDAE